MTAHRRGSVHKAILARMAARVDRPIIINIRRAEYVEDQVGLALGSTWRYLGEPWDFEDDAGRRVEVKASAARQTWKQTQPSKAKFDIARRTGYWDKESVWVDHPGRNADVYVLAWHGRYDDGADQRDETQWEYYVVPARSLPNQKSIGLARVRRLAEPVSWDGLADAVDAVLRSEP
jgi:hypothetical protein